MAYTAQAYTDLGDIYAYLAFERKAPRTAKAQVDRIRKAVAALQTFPESCPVVDWRPWAAQGVRKMPVDHYVVFYCVDKSQKRATVLRIFYGGRDVEHLVCQEETDREGN